MIGVRYFTCVGDSKSNNVRQWINFLSILSNRRPYELWAEYPNRISIAGHTVEEMAADIDAAIASRASGQSEIIMFNMGANDVGALPAENDWKADLRYCWDAIHAWQPSARMKYMLIWRRDFETECDTLNQWCAGVAAEEEYSSWVSVGPDERIFLENGDDGATYTDDGVHPNSLGMFVTASQWVDDWGLR